MEYVIGTKQSGSMTEDQYQKILKTIVLGMDPVKTATTFVREPGVTGP